MRTSAPPVLPVFRSEMQMRLLTLLLLQAERTWTLKELATALGAAHSSVHRELARAEAAGLIRRDGSAKPHRFQAASEDPLYEPLATLLRASLGIEAELSAALDRPDVSAAVIHGSWPTGVRRPGSDIDVLVVGDADLRELRRVVRPIGKAAGRAIDLVVMREAEFRKAAKADSSFTRKLLTEPSTPLVGDMSGLLAQ